MKGAKVTLSTFEKESLKAAAAMIERLRVEERGAVAALDIVICYQRRLAERYKASPVMHETLIAPIDNLLLWREALDTGRVSLDRLKEMIAELPL